MPNSDLLPSLLYKINHHHHHHHHHHHLVYSRKPGHLINHWLHVSTEPDSSGLGKPKKRLQLLQPPKEQKP